MGPGITMEEERYRIPMFDGKNFACWKFRMEVILDQHEFKKFVEIDLETLLNNEASEKGKDGLKKAERKYKVIIISYIADSQLEHIQVNQTAKEIFHTLKFERKCIANQLFIRKKLLSTKYSEKEDMNAYLLNFDKCVRQLRESGAYLKDLDILCHLLLSLPKSYETVIETMKEESLSLEFVKKRLLNEYNKRRNETVPHHTVTPAAFSSFKFKCYGCEKIRQKCSVIGFMVEAKRYTK